MILNISNISLVLLIPFLGTVLGSAMVFLMKNKMNIKVEKLLLGFAAGAMIYVVVDELIPGSQSGEHSNIGVIGVAIGFIIMMILDVALG